MHINSITVNGFQAIREFHVELEGNSVEITAANRRGKSSLLRAIWVSLTGKEVPDGMVNNDSLKAQVVIDMTGHTVTWTCKKSGDPVLKVVRDDGEPIQGGARTYLTKLVGDISFDPMDFAEMAPKDQKDEAQKILGLDFSDLDQAKTVALAKKKESDAQAKAYQRQLDEFGPISRVEEVNVDDLLKEQAARQEVADSGKALAATDAALKEKLRSQVDRIEGLKQQITSLQASLADAEQVHQNLSAESASTFAKLEETRAKYKELRDPAPLISEAQETNKKASAWKQAQGVQEKLAQAEAAVAKAATEIEEIEAERVKRLSEAKVPVSGLEFTEDGLLYRGLPFNKKCQCTSDLIKVGAALQIMKNPGLRIMRIGQGESLDKESKAKVLEVVKEYGFQAFIETVSEGDVRAVVLETRQEEEENG